MIASTALGYVRVSTDEQANGYGLDVQRERIEQFCRQERLQLFEVFEDVGVPGSTALAERPGLSAAYEAAREYVEPVISGLVVARFDRLARDTLQALLIERDFSNAGAPILCAEGLNGDEDSVRLMRTMLHGIAEFEKRQLVARLAAARRAKAARGGYAGGRPPFGYRADGGALAPVAAEAEVVRWMFERVARDGWSVRRVQRALDAEGTLGKRWHSSEVGRILKRKDYKLGPHGARIVDPKVWNRAQVVLAERRPANV